MHLTGSTNAYPKQIWPSVKKMVDVTIDGYAVDALSIIRDGNCNGVSSAFFVVEGRVIGIMDLLDENESNISLTICVKAKKGKIYNTELHAADT